MKKFAIYSPTMGEREDYPVILLNNAVTSENNNTQIWDGEIRKAKLRRAEMLRAAYFSDIQSDDLLKMYIPLNDLTGEFSSGDDITMYSADGTLVETFEVDTISYSATSVVTTITVKANTSGITDFLPFYANYIDNGQRNYVFSPTGVVSADPNNESFRLVSIPDGNAILKYYLSTGSTADDFLLAFTKLHIYKWVSATSTWLELEAVTECEQWDACSYGNYVVMTNGVDRPMQMATNSTTITNVDTNIDVGGSDVYIATAKYVKSYRNYLIFGNIEYSDGNKYPDSFAWSNIGEGVDAGGFDQSAGKDAGTAIVSANTIDGDGGDISGGFGLWQSYLVIFRRRAISKVWFVGGDIPFRQSVLQPSVGCIAPGSVVNDRDGNLFFYGTDKSIREVSLGEVSQGLVKTVRDICPGLVDKIASTFIDEYNEIWWAIPYGSEATANNKIIKFKQGKWDESDIPIVAFGKYNRTATYMWDTLPYATWDTWAWDTWDATDFNEDFAVDLCSDAEGRTYELHGSYLDDGDEYDSYFVVTTDVANKQALAYYKRILQMHIYCMSNGATTDDGLKVYVKRDTEGTWQYLGEVTLDGTNKIARKRLSVDIRARHFEMKFSSTNLFKFIGVEFEYVPLGDR